MQKPTFKLAMIMTAAALAACTPTDDPTSPPPPADQIRSMAVQEYTGFYGRAPKNLQITKIARTNVFSQRLDTVVCISTQEERESPIYNDQGILTKPVGSKYVGSHAFMIRDYLDSGWSPTLFRRVTPGREMGSLDLNDICPRSTFWG